MKITINNGYRVAVAMEHLSLGESATYGYLDKVEAVTGKKYSDHQGVRVFSPHQLELVAAALAIREAEDTQQCLVELALYRYERAQGNRLVERVTDSFTCTLEGYTLEVIQAVASAEQQLGAVVERAGLVGQQMGRVSAVMGSQLAEMRKHEDRFAGEVFQALRFGLICGGVAGVLLGGVLGHWLRS